MIFICILLRFLEPILPSLSELDIELEDVSEHHEVNGGSSPSDSADPSISSHVIPPQTDVSDKTKADLSSNFQQASGPSAPGLQWVDFAAYSQIVQQKLDAEDRVSELELETDELKAQIKEYQALVTKNDQTVNQLLAERDDLKAQLDQTQPRLSLTSKIAIIHVLLFLDRDFYSY